MKITSLRPPPVSEHPNGLVAIIIAAFACFAISVVLFVWLAL